MEIVFWIIGGLFLYVIVGLGGWLLKGIGAIFAFLFEGVSVIGGCIIKLIAIIFFAYLVLAMLCSL